MTENIAFSYLNIENVCRACFTINDNVSTMSPEEIIWYQTLTVQVPMVESKMKICVICRHILKKFARFSDQCQKAQYIFSGNLQQEQKQQIMPVTNYSISPLKLLYVGPENSMDLDDLQDFKNSDDFDCAFEYDDDEVPLVMLNTIDNRSSVMEKSRKIKRKKLKCKKLLQNEMSSKLQTEINLNNEQLATEASCKQKINKKSKKTVKEGFSSRMVHETEEYVVIKLTKEQVLEEMQEKLKSDKYVRALYKCEKCVKGFNFEDVLRSHMEKHSKENAEFQCDICTQYCPSAVSLRGHMKSHTTRYKCKVCGDIRLSRQHLLEHHAISHTSHATEYTCEHCYFTTNKRTVIQRHVRTHKRSERHACHECGRLFQNMESLRVHTTRHDKSKSLQCEHCNRKFIYPSLLQKHIQSVHVQKDYYCVECDVRFKSPDNLRLHFKKAKKHRDSSSYTLPSYCERSKLWSLGHPDVQKLCLKCVEGSLATPFCYHQCPQCSDRFVSSTSLSVHMSTAHGHPASHQCTTCGRTYSSRRALRGHERRRMCGDIVARKSVVATHARSHAGEQSCAGVES